MLISFAWNSDYVRWSSHWQWELEPKSIVMSAYPLLLISSEASRNYSDCYVPVVALMKDQVKIFFNLTAGYIHDVRLPLRQLDV